MNCYRVCRRNSASASAFQNEVLFWVRLFVLTFLYEIAILLLGLLVLALFVVIWIWSGSNQPLLSSHSPAPAVTSDGGDVMLMLLCFGIGLLMLRQAWREWKKWYLITKRHPGHVSPNLCSLGEQSS